MKTRGLIIITLCFSLFGQAQDSVSRTGTENNIRKKATAKNIILLIGDGMGVAQLYAGMVVNNGHLNIEQMKHIGLSKTYSANDFVTDSGAAGTALATGQKTYKRAIGVSVDTIPIKSILEIAEENNKATGLVATSTITHATPASFIAHQPSRYNYEEIAEDFLKTDIEVFIGGGLKHFNDRKDGQDLTKTLKANGYDVIVNPYDIVNSTSDKIAGLIYEDSPPKHSQGRGDMLPQSAVKAMVTLNRNPNGFFLMIEGSQIDWGAHKKNTDYVVEEMLDFDKTVGEVLKFAEADGNTLVIVTADHETGGMTINEGDIKKGEVKAKFTSFDHTGVMVPVFAYGPGSEDFCGIYENTEIFHKMKQAFGFNDLTKILIC